MDIITQNIQINVAGLICWIDLWQLAVFYGEQHTSPYQYILNFVISGAAEDQLREKEKSLLNFCYGLQMIQFKPASINIISHILRNQTINWSQTLLIEHTHFII